jgi:RNA polymerase sigma-70 factor (ECF subfamily)
VNAVYSETLEQRIRAAHEAGDLPVAATLLMEGYGPEIYGFLASRLRDREFTADVFGDFAEDLWRGLKTFHWGCTVRAWAYTLARHAASRGIRGRRRRGARNVPLSHAGPLSEIAERVRSETSIQLRTTKQTRMAALREQLPEFERMLLILRVNRQLAWLEIARIMAPGTAEAALNLTEEELQTEAARLRKRFQKAKEKLRQLAEQAGLLTE